MFPLFLGICGLIGSATSLRLEDAEEGSCQGIRYKELPHIDLDFIDSLNYMPAGNRYQMYRMASNHPRFDEMRDFEMYYNGCYEKNVSYVDGGGTTFGFGGRVLSNYVVRPRREQNTIIDVTPVIKPYDPTRVDRIQKHVTLTDHKTYVFFADCWVGSDQRAWDVYSLTPELSRSAKREIEEHAVSLGFKRDQMVFLDYGSCGRDPLPENDNDESEEDGRFGSGLGWKGSSFGRNPIPLPGRLVPLLSIGRSHFRSSSGKIVSSRATISPIAGNTNLRRASNGNAGGVTSRLSLASAGNGWTRK